MGKGFVFAVATHGYLWVSRIVSAVSCNVLSSYHVVILHAAKQQIIGYSILRQ